MSLVLRAFILRKKDIFTIVLSRKRRKVFDMTSVTVLFVACQDSEFLPLLLAYLFLRKPLHGFQSAQFFCAHLYQYLYLFSSSEGDISTLG